MILKFRVWDKRCHKMVCLNNKLDSFTFGLDGEASYYNFENGDVSDWRYSNPMQFTGLFDKHEVEIYYHDIVEYNDHAFIVLYDKGSFVLVRLNDYTYSYELFSDCWDGEVYPLRQLWLESVSKEENIICELEVIGNHYY